MGAPWPSMGCLFIPRHLESKFGGWDDVRLCGSACVCVSGRVDVLSIRI